MAEARAQHSRRSVPGCELSAPRPAEGGCGKANTSHPFATWSAPSPRCRPVSPGGQSAARLITIIVYRLAHEAIEQVSSNLLHPWIGPLKFLVGTNVTGRSAQPV